MKKWLVGFTLLVSIVVSIVVCLGLPVYQGLAYRGKLPMLPFGYVEWLSEQPFENQVYDEAFESAANKAISALIEQQKAIAAPGYTAAVAYKNEVVWAGSVGWANITNKAAMTTDTQLRVGSTSKAITATGLAKLVASKQLDLDAPLSSYFNKIPNPEWANITARQLASHMAGIPHYKENTELLGALATLSAQTHYPNVS